MELLRIIAALRLVSVPTAPDANSLPCIAEAGVMAAILLPSVAPMVVYPNVGSTLTGYVASSKNFCGTETASVPFASSIFRSHHVSVPMASIAFGR